MKSEPGKPLPKGKISISARTFLPWQPWPTFSTESADISLSLKGLGSNSADGGLDWEVGVLLCHS